MNIRKLLTMIYTEEFTSMTIDNIACERCSHKDKNRECPMGMNDGCIQTDEEAINHAIDWLEERGLICHEK